MKIEVHLDDCQCEKLAYTITVEACPTDTPPEKPEESKPISFGKRVKKAVIRFFVTDDYYVD